MRIIERGILLALALGCAGASGDDLEAYRVELTTSVWWVPPKGAVRAGQLPVDFASDLALGDSPTFFGRLVWKPGRRHKVIVEGSPYRFAGDHVLTRTVTFQGRVYSFNERIQSEAELDYFSAGYGYDILNGPSGHLGLSVSGAYFRASGTLAAPARSIEGSDEQTVGLPLVGLSFRRSPWPGSSVLSIQGDVKGISVGRYGHFVQGSLEAGVNWRWISVLGGYQFLNSDIHESTNRPQPSGVRTRFTGPIFTIQFRDR